MTLKAGMSCTVFYGKTIMSSFKYFGQCISLVSQNIKDITLSTDFKKKASQIMVMKHASTRNAVACFRLKEVKTYFLTCHYFI